MMSGFRARRRARRGGDRAHATRRQVWGESGLVRAVQQVFILLIVFVSLAPLYTAVTTSFTPAGELSGGGILPPPNPTFDNYRLAWGDLGFQGMFSNSAILAVTAAIGTTLLGAAAAFALVRFRFKGRRVLLVAIIGAIAVPPIVIIIPLFLTMSGLGWVNTYHSAIIAEIGLLLPFAIFLLYSFMKDLPEDLFDAAALDGAGSVGQFWHVALPLSRSALVTTGIVSGIFAWNELLVPLILWQQDKFQTLMLGLATLGPGRTGVRYVPLLMAGVTITIVPLVILFVIGRRALLRGLTEGALK